MMRILHVIPSMDEKMGGVVQGVRTIVTSLSELNIHNEIACLDSPDAAFLQNYNFVINALGPGKGPWSYNKALYTWLVNNFLRFDVVIAHGLWQYHSHAAVRAYRYHQKRWSPTKTSRCLKFFVMPHGMLDPYFQLAKGRKLKAIRNWIFWKVIEHRVINNATGLMFTCEEECRLARIPFNPYHPKKESIVGLGINEPPRFENPMCQAFLQLCPSLEGKHYLLFLGRIDEKKGIDILVEAYAKNVIENKGQMVPDLVIAGPGLETNYGKRIIQRVQNDPLIRDRIFFPGMLTGLAKWGAFYGCDAFALFSHQENFGIAIVEALACSRAVIITDQVNIWKEIETVGGGIVGPASLNGGVHMLNKWIQMEIRDQKLMSTNARLAYEKYFSIKPVAKSLLDTIEN